MRCETDESWVNYKMLRNKCTAAIRLAKCNFFLDSTQNNPTKFWHQVKFCTGLGKLKRAVLPWACSSTAINKSSADAINERFVCSIQATVANTNCSGPNTAYSEVPIATANITIFKFSELIESEIMKAIGNLDACGSSGCNGISPRMLKFCC